MSVILRAISVFWTGVSRPVASLQTKIGIEFSFQFNSTLHFHFSSVWLGWRTLFMPVRVWPKSAQGMGPPDFSVEDPLTAKNRRSRDTNLPYQQRTERVDEAILRCLSEAAE